MREFMGARALVCGSLLLVAVACRPSSSVSLDTGSAAPPRLAARIAFVRDGDVYVLNTTGGAETRLSSDGNGTAPRWTSDGQQLFFESEAANQRRTWRWQPGAAPVQVQAGVWSPDGKRVAFSDPAAGVRGPSQVWVEVNGQRTAVGPSEPDAAWSPLAWSPDSTRLALSRIHLVPSPIPTAPGLYPTDGALWLVGPSSGQRRQVLLPVEWDDAIRNIGWPDAVSWTPSGQALIVWVGPPNPCNSCRADGTSMIGLRISDGSTIALGNSLGPGFLTWMRNDAAVAVEPSGRETYQNKHLVRVEPATGRRAPLTDEAHFADLEPAVAPDGKLIVFARGRALQDPLSNISSTQPLVTASPASANTPLDLIRSRRLWQIAADGSQLHQLTEPGDWTDESPVWTSDGQWIIFVRWHAAPGAQASVQLWAMRPDGSSAQRLIDRLQVPRDFHDGFGYYGALGWQQLFAVGPP